MIQHWQKNARRVVKHHWLAWRFGYALCGNCGLVWLKNPVSNKAAKAACPGWEED